MVDQGEYRTTHYTERERGESGGESIDKWRLRCSSEVLKRAGT